MQEATAYAAETHDNVRERFERTFLQRTVARLLPKDGTLLDLGCGHGLARGLEAAQLGGYLGVDMRDPGPGLPGRFVMGDLREGLPSLAGERFDLGLAAFGLASHLSPAELRRLLGQLARGAQPGALVAIEALGLHSLEWPLLWNRPVGSARTIPYRLGADVPVHPWAPRELCSLLEQAGMKPLVARDRSVQAGPKAGEGRYWRLPPLRQALETLLTGPADGEGREALAASLGPLPCGPAAVMHHELARRRRELVADRAHESASLARAVWELEPRSGGGYGHGLMVVARVP